MEGLGWRPPGLAIQVRGDTQVCCVKERAREKRK